MSCASPEPFQISVPQDAIDAVKQKLDATTLPPPAPPSDDSLAYGAPLEDITHLLEYWKTTYNWKNHEAALNEELPQFRLDIPVHGHGSLLAHFVHQKAKCVGQSKAIPLLFIHGWPGSFIEVRKILPLLTSPGRVGDLVFDVVAPSLPGFGFTSAPGKAGFSLDQYAEASRIHFIGALLKLATIQFCHHLMLALGYKAYVVQGGDWGFIISHRIVHRYGPKHVKAWHTNYPKAAGPPTLLGNPLMFLAHHCTPWTEEEKKSMERNIHIQNTGRAYFTLHSTKPQTLGYLLADSPVGLLAWIYEKLVGWTDRYPWTDDEVLTWIHIYLFSHVHSTSSAATSVRIYFEASRARDWDALADRRFYNGRVPMGISVFPRELVVVPSSWHRTLGWVVYSARHARGGHFAAYERPAELVADVRGTLQTPQVKARL
ncbi:hypothetical protein PHLGIDRAFT_123272 [Phlebiopsis gigantea 11061_1 CR5-6]|uniref:Epoxide hydrolase N-terminal domain-containing protein n=1 Tax=Phlebiopsis gigantea (strain 11061_1 CR5-6) TaxID=745531 RepID=A0A0C3RYY4_PHLG1|nr:hypothetical protein PHLGIDRAFT_123272 [Phlebiopsis gigantea 11061_1 CR5-6]